MSDPATLGADARLLRAAAAGIRGRAAGLVDALDGVRRGFPLPDDDVWSGPDARTFADRIAASRSAVTRLADSAAHYATECERAARAKDRDAADLEAAAARGATT